MAASTFSPATAFLSNSTPKFRRPINSLSSFTPISSSNRHPLSSSPRLVIPKTKSLSPRGAHLLDAVAGLVNDNSESYPEPDPSDSNAAATVDTKLPRRSLLVQFSCGACGKRIQRLIN